jgi:drug/metabolite transporter (DMT)-like permease
VVDVWLSSAWALYIAFYHWLIRPFLRFLGETTSVGVSIVGASVGTMACVMIPMSLAGPSHKIEDPSALLCILGMFLTWFLMFSTWMAVEIEFH